VDGSNIGVAVIDSGIAPHLDLQTSDGLQSRIVYSESFLPSDPSPVDTYGHGTHVAGIVGSNGLSSSAGGYRGDFRGMAPNVSLINLRVLDANGSGTDSTVIAGIERAIQLKDTYNIRVINLSFGTNSLQSYQLDPLAFAAEVAWKSGIVVVVAAGNGGSTTTSLTDPAIDPFYRLARRIAGLIAQHQAIALGGVIGLEELGVPLPVPGDVFILYAGDLVARGKLAFWPCLL